MISNKKLRLEIKTEDTCFIDFIGDTCEVFRINDYACNRNGYYSFGKCYCFEGYYGDSCSCKIKCENNGYCNGNKC